MTEAQWVWDFIRFGILPAIAASFGFTIGVWKEGRKGRKEIWAYVRNHYKELSDRVARLEAGHE